MPHHDQIPGESFFFFTGQDTCNEILQAPELPRATEQTGLATQRTIAEGVLTKTFVLTEYYVTAIKW